MSEVPQSQPQSQTQDQIEAQKQIEGLIRQRREELKGKTHDELVDIAVNMWHVNANMNQSLINLSTYLDTLGDSMIQNGVEMRNISKQIAPKSIDEIKRIQNTQRNQKDGFANRQERRDYELRKHDKLKELSKS